MAAPIVAAVPNITRGTEQSVEWAKRCDTVTGSNAVRTARTVALRAKVSGNMTGITAARINEPSSPRLQSGDCLPKFPRLASFAAAPVICAAPVLLRSIDWPALTPSIRVAPPRLRSICRRTDIMPERRSAFANPACANVPTSSADVERTASLGGSRHAGTREGHPRLSHCN